MNNKSEDRLLILDFVKGVAAIMIVITHSTQYLEGISWQIKNITNLGSMGCQLFFLVSGILAFFSINKENSNVGRFYKRRFVNIVPAYYFMIFIYWILSFLNWGWEQTHSKVSIMMNLLMLHGIFVKGSNDVVPGGWYIGVLVVFYALTPILCWGVIAIYKRFCKYYIWMAVLYAILLGGSILVGMLCNSMFNGRLMEIFNVTYTGWICQLCPFITGIVLGYQMYWSELPANMWACRFICLFSFLLSLVSFFEVKINIRLRVYFWTLFFYVGFILLMNNWDKLRKGRITELIAKWGKISYAVFLVHYVFCSYVFPVLAKILKDIGCNNGNARYGLVMCIGMVGIYGGAKMFDKLMNTFQKCFCMRKNNFTE